MAYTISIEELAKRSVIRNDRPEEWMNKMTDEELYQWERETEAQLLADGVEKKYPEWNAAMYQKSIDRSILYEMLKNTF
jgi:hypothetical protein